MVGAQSIVVSGDLSKPANVVRLFEEAIKALGKVDIAVNSASLVINKPIADVTEADYGSSFDVNAQAAFFFIQQAGKNLEDSGRIVTIASALLAAYAGLSG